MELSSSGYFILASLQGGPLHGYGIIKRAETLSDGRMRLAVGTLYGLIDRLASNDLIALASVEIVDGRVRRSYSLTPTGMRTLHEEAARLAQAASIVRPAACAALQMRPA